MMDLLARMRTTHRAFQGVHSPAASTFSLSTHNSGAYSSFSDVLNRASEFPDVVPVMFSSSRVRRGLMPAAYPLVFAPPELQFSASVFLNSSFSFLGHSLFGSRPRMTKDSSSVSSVTALVDSGADVHILSYEDALTSFWT